MQQKQDNKEPYTLCHRVYTNVSHDVVLIFIKHLFEFYYFGFYLFLLVPTALSMDGKLIRIVPGETEIEHFVQEIEQHDYLMEDSPAGEQLRM